MLLVLYVAPPPFPLQLQNTGGGACLNGLKSVRLPEKRKYPEGASFYREKSLLMSHIARNGEGDLNRSVRGPEKLVYPELQLTNTSTSILKLSCLQMRYVKALANGHERTNVDFEGSRHAALKMNRPGSESVTRLKE